MALFRDVFNDGFLVLLKIIQLRNVWPLRVLKLCQSVNYGSSVEWCRRFLGSKLLVWLQWYFWLLRRCLCIRWFDMNQLFFFEFLAQSQLSILTLNLLRLNILALPSLIIRNLVRDKLLCDQMLWGNFF